MSTDRLFAVVTGDVVGSSDFERRKRETLPDLLRAVYRETQSTVASEVHYPIDPFGGDSWQFCLPDPVNAASFVTHFRASLLARAGVKTRCAVAIDTIDFLNTENISESDGAAFRRSGRQLQQLRGTKLEVVLPESSAPPVHLAADALARSLDYAYQGWSEAQAQSILHRLTGLLAGEPLSQSEIASRWQPTPITQQAVAKHLKSAHWELVQESVSDFAKLIAYIVSNVSESGEKI